MIIHPSGKIRVLVVDDSTSMRMLVRAILTSDPSIEVVGVAADGIEAVEKAEALKPEVITLDVEMPRMNGIDALRQIMVKAPSKVIMLSSLTQEGAKTTFEALDAGAFDFVPKRAGYGFEAEILNKVKESVRSNFGVTAKGAAATAKSEGSVIPVQSMLARNKRINVVGIGTSTGGPLALQEVLSRIPASFPYGIVVAIHMPKTFTATYSERINSKCAITVREAVDGDLVKQGVALIAPGGVHTTIVRHNGGMMVKTVPSADYPKHVYVPSVDLMLSSLAEVTAGSMLGVIMTGMGSDGFKGMQLLKQKGGTTIVQDEATSTIYGMPRACIMGGVADVVLPLGKIGDEIAKIAAA
ncbi:MAG: chemotaxis response regulator protein-glutamate methylesterase [Desulfuromonadaceae bacterium]|nr:chemotaxis response regulator protein-glutamate methylesterase [Desulfuromonadaceae bacterium]MDD2855581.1 chemotaxis response regulator protein-glutamate methylesterase [Desulfuromonadaceae bacterium]